MDQEMISILRMELENYYGTAMQELPMAVMDLSDIEYMSDEEIVAEARKHGLISE